MQGEGICGLQLFQVFQGEGICGLQLFQGEQGGVHIQCKGNFLTVVKLESQ